MKKKYPDNIVYNEKSETYDASQRSFPTTVGSQKFEAIKLDKSHSIRANNFFDSKFKELKESYQKLVEEYNWNKIIYESEYSFQPISGKTYHLYQRENQSYWLSIIAPQNWNKKHIGSFKLLTNGKWEKIYGEDKR